MNPDMVTAIAATATAVISLFGFIGLGATLVYSYGKLAQRVKALEGRMGRQEKWQDNVSLVYLTQHQQPHGEGDG